MSSSSLKILVPNLPESVTDATVAVWHKKEGDKVQERETLLAIETDKIMLEIPSPKPGILEKILEKEGSIVIAGQILGHLILNDNNIIKNIDENQENIQSSFNKDIIESHDKCVSEDTSMPIVASPAARKLIAEKDLNIIDIPGNVIKRRISREDIETYLQKQSSTIHAHTDINIHKYTDNYNVIDNVLSDNIHNVIKDTHNRTDKRIKMSRLRKTISERLLSVTNSTAMLTTFNEINMQPVMILRNKYQNLFEQRYKIKLGFLSFYIKAVLEGLRKFPEVNAAIDGEEIIYHNYFDISIAVSTDRGLVTPVLRNVDILNIADIEKKIKSLAKKGKDSKLTLEELTGGTFTITNGGIFGSLISTPIINPPQSAILGIHVIKERPVAVNGKIIILPMMYVALSYDHRLIDGKDSVSFLMTIKELIEDPIRLLLDI